MNWHIAGLLLLSSTLLFSSALSAQGGGNFRMSFRADGGAAGDKCGFSVSAAGDLNGDGYEDVIVGSPAASPNGMSAAGSITVYSGLDYTVLLQLDGSAPAAEFGYSASGIGDIDSDGKSDIIVGAPGAGTGGMTWVGAAYVYSGGSGVLLFQFDGSAAGDYLGDSVASAGDVDGDGIGDFIISADGADPNGMQDAGTAFVYSGATGNLINMFNGSAPFDYFGYPVSGAGDVDGDGFADIVIGASGADPSGNSRAGSAFIYSGATGSLLFQFDGGGIGDFLGYAVSGAGDVDHDGHDDVIVGALYADPAGLTDAGSAYVYSGSSGGMLLQIDGAEPGGRFGFSVSGAGDLDGDGFSDFVVGSDRADPQGLIDAGSAFAYSGATGNLLFRFDGEAAGASFGRSVSGAGDLDSDGFADLVIGADGANPGGMNSAGSAYLFSFDPMMRPDLFTVSASAGGLRTLQLDFPAQAGGYDYAILMSRSGVGAFYYGVNIPLILDSMVRMSAQGIYPFSTANGLHGILDSTGDAVATVDVPPGAYSHVVGSTFRFAAVAFPAGAMPELSSAAVPITIGP